MKLTIGYFYPNELNLYGDTGNIEILAYRARTRGFDVEVLEIDSNTRMSSALVSSLNLLFMGGGPDSSQKIMYRDLLENKRPYLEDYVEMNGTSLLICGSYQLFGNYYKSSDSLILDGLGIFDMYTEHFGSKKSRCVGNMLIELSSELRHDPVFNSVNKIGSEILGFENHGGRTYLGSRMLPLGKVLFGFGNNGEDYSEGILYKGCIGTYSHGPVLSKNPHLADYLIARALHLEELALLDDHLIVDAHHALRSRLF